MAGTGHPTHDHDLTTYQLTAHPHHHCCNGANTLADFGPQRSGWSFRQVPGPIAPLTRACLRNRLDRELRGIDCWSSIILAELVGLGKAALRPKQSEVPMGSAAVETPHARGVDMKLEVVVIPVSNVDRATTRHLHLLDPLGTRWSRLKRVTEILGLTDNLLILKFHDAHCIRRLPIVSEDEFGHPEIGSTNYSPH